MQSWYVAFKWKFHHMDSSSHQSFISEISDCFSQQGLYGYMGNHDQYEDNDQSYNCSPWTEFVHYQSLNTFPDATIADAANYCRHYGNGAFGCYNASTQAIKKCTIRPQCRGEKCNLNVSMHYELMRCFRYVIPLAPPHVYCLYIYILTKFNVHSKSD